MVEEAEEKLQVVSIVTCVMTISLGWREQYLLN